MSTRTKYSAGPWQFDGSKIVSPERYVCTVDDWSAIGSGRLPACFDEMNRALHEEAQSNARLIAAAPDLADALRTMLAVFCEDDGITPEACQAAEESARAALKAAEEGRP